MGQSISFQGFMCGTEGGKHWDCQLAKNKIMFYKYVLEKALETERCRSGKAFSHQRRLDEHARTKSDTQTHRG